MRVIVRFKLAVAIEPLLVRMMIGWHLDVFFICATKQAWEVRTGRAGAPWSGRQSAVQCGACCTFCGGERCFPADRAES
jgi:hypothetical protein